MTKQQKHPGQQVLDLGANDETKVPTDNPIVAQIDKLPPDWSLIPVRDKRPYTRNWEDGKISRDDVIADLGKGRATGYGLITGNGLISLDIDGTKADLAAKELGIPETLSWTSGKEGRSGHLYRVPPTWLDRLADCTSHDIKLDAFDVDGKQQGLNTRYNSHQCVLPPSAHPETGSYRWINQGVDVVDAPEWMLIVPAR